jgi:formylmethanofuran dehydrogenase subunit A
MDKTFRNDILSTLHPEAQKASHLGSLDREYTLYEIAIMTRAGAAKLVGLADRGSLGVGTAADITVYTDNEDREKMFSKPDYVFKDGTMVVKDGEIIEVTWGTTHVVKPEYDNSIEKSLKPYFDKYHTQKMGNFKISDDEIVDDGRGSITVQPLHAGGKI